MAKWPRTAIGRNTLARGYPKWPFLEQKRYVTSNAFVTPTVSLPRDFVPVHTPKQPANIPNTEKKPLHGRLVAIKDNVCTQDFPTTCASSILGNFKSPYNATVVELLRQAGAVIQGKTNMDEFGMGSHTTLSRFGAVQNYAEAEDMNHPLSAGGSSGGSAMAVKEGKAWAALGTDTGGSVRLPAAYTGTVGFKPSYGLLSRYGVVAYANSLDTVGILARNLDVVRLMFEVLNKHDPNDPTSLSESTRSRIVQIVEHRTLMASQLNEKLFESQRRHYKIGVPHEYNIKELAAPVRSAWKNTLGLLQSCEHSIHSVSLPTTKQALSAYYVLAPAEACSNLAKYDGVRYGQRAGAKDDDTGYLFAKTRGDGFGKEVQRRILLGTYSLSAATIDNYFIQAQRVRRLVQQDFDAVFSLPNPLRSRLDNIANDKDKVDLIIVPTAPTPPPKLSSVTSAGPLDAYMNDVFTVPASLAGLPAISVPGITNDLDSDGPQVTGVQLIGQFGDDRLILEAAQTVRKIIASNGP